MIWKLTTAFFALAFVVSAAVGGLYFWYYHTTDVAFYGNDVVTWYTPGKTFLVDTETGTYELEVFSVREIGGEVEHALMFKGTRQTVPFLMSHNEISYALATRQLRPMKTYASSLSQ